MLSNLAANTNPVDYTGHSFIGTVVANNDPDKNERVKVTIPGVYEGAVADLPWVAPKVARLFGSTTSAAVFGVPVLGSQVFVEFQHGDPHYPLYVGCPTLKKQSIPESEVNYPNRYGLKDTAGNLVIIDPTPGQNQLIIRHASGTVFQINNDGSIVLNSVGGITSTAPSWTHTGDITVQGNVHSTQSVIGDVDVLGNGVSLSSHTHGGVDRGNSNTNPPN